jgi:hypothetical protein
MYTYLFARNTCGAAHSRDVSCHQAEEMSFADSLPMTTIHLAYRIYCFQVFPLELAGKDTHKPLRE